MEAEARSRDVTVDLRYRLRKCLELLAFLASNKGQNGVARRSGNIFRDEYEPWSLSWLVLINPWLPFQTFFSGEDILGGEHMASGDTKKEKPNIYNHRSMLYLIQYYV